MLGYTPQARKPCTCPASRRKKEHGVSNRDFSGLMDRGIYMSEARSWSDTPTVDNGQDVAVVFAPGGWRWGAWRGLGVTSYGGVDIRLANRLPGKLAEGYAPHHPFDMLSWWLKLEQSLAGAWGKYVGRSVR